MIRLPPSTPAQRASLYEDVEALLFPGFISHPASLGEIPICVRTLGPGDMFALRARMTAPSAEWRVWTVASSIWMVNGINLLEEPGVVPRLAGLVANLPSSLQEILFTLVIGLFSRQSRAGQAVESFCYETQSRYLWRAMGGTGFSHHVGIPGAERLGTNHIQRMWSAYNVFEDQRDRDEMLWEGFKLTASASAPKGIQKLDSLDKERKAKESARRQEVQDRFFYWIRGVIDSPNIKIPDKAVWGSSSGSKSVEDLEEEMRRWVSGEEDFHDKVIKEYKRRIVERVEQEKAEQQRIMGALQSEATLRAAEMLPSTTLVGYTPDQLSQIVGDRQAGSSGTRQVDLGGDTRGYLYGRYLERAPAKGLLKVEDGKLVVQESGSGNLSQEVAQRQVRFSQGSE